MKSEFGFFKAIFVLAFIFIVCTGIYRLYLITSNRNGGKQVYEIEVQNFNGEQDTYVTFEYQMDENSKCIKFKDEFGIKRTVCGNYTITQY